MLQIAKNFAMNLLVTSGSGYGLVQKIYMYTLMGKEKSRVLYKVALYKNLRSNILIYYLIMVN